MKPDAGFLELASDRFDEVFCGYDAGICGGREPLSFVLLFLVHILLIWQDPGPRIMKTQGRPRSLSAGCTGKDEVVVRAGVLHRNDTEAR